MKTPGGCDHFAGLALFIISVFVIAVSSVFLSSCAGSRAAPDVLANRYLEFREKVDQRVDSIHTASYRIRWRIREIQPHSDLILRVDYRAPDQYHVVGKGPMDVPVFTAWLSGNRYVLILHRERNTRRGSIDDLDLEEFLLDTRSFTELLGLLVGGCGVSLPERYDQADPRWEIEGTWTRSWTDDSGRRLQINLKHSRANRFEWEYRDPAATGDFEIRFGRFSRNFPFWEIRSGWWKNKSGPGRYEWDILQQVLNPALADRLFDPPTSN